MNRVHVSQQSIDAYLDGELVHVERESLMAHCDDCDVCQTLLDSRRALLTAIRSVRPRVNVTPELRSRVSAMVEGSEPGTGLRFKWSGRKSAASANKMILLIRPIFAYALLCLLLAGVGLSVFRVRKEARSARFIEMAVEAHRKRLKDALPIQFTSSSARQVSNWFDSKLPFAFRLPTYQDDSRDRSRYELVGASLTSFEGKAAAYVAYRMQKELISLVVVSADQAVASGGETTKAKSIEFHSVDKNDLEAITWSVHHLSYALVSNVKLPRRQSCVVCHADPKDQVLRQTAVAHSSCSYDLHPFDINLLNRQFSAVGVRR